MNVQVSPDVSTRRCAPELDWIGDGMWVIHDPAMPRNDARYVIAYIQHRDHRVYVLWVRDRRDERCYETLREAVIDITACWASPNARDATAAMDHSDLHEGESPL